MTWVEAKAVTTFNSSQETKHILHSRNSDQGQKWKPNTFGIVQMIFIEGVNEKCKL